MKRLLIKICKISTTYNVKLSENISYELSLSLPTKLLKYWKRGQEPEPTYSLGCSQTRLYTVVAWGRFVLANSSLAYGQFYISCYSSELERGNQKCWQSSFDSHHSWLSTYANTSCMNLPWLCRGHRSPQLTWVMMVAGIGEGWTALAPNWRPPHYTNMLCFFTFIM